MNTSRITPLHTPPPAPPTVALSEITVTTPAGREFKGDDIAALLAVAAHHPSVYGMTAADDANMMLRGLGAICQHVGRDSDDLEDDEYMMWFIGEMLASVAARLEAGHTNASREDATKYTVNVLTPAVA